MQCPVVNRWAASEQRRSCLLDAFDEVNEGLARGARLLITQLSLAYVRFERAVDSTSSAARAPSSFIPRRASSRIWLNSSSTVARTSGAKYPTPCGVYPCTRENPSLPNSPCGVALPPRRTLCNRAAPT